MRNCWWIIKNSEGIPQVVYVSVRAREMVSEILGPYWSQAEAEKFLALWKQSKAIAKERGKKKWPT